MMFLNALGSAFNEVSPRRDSAGYFASLPTSERMRVSPRAFSLEKAMELKGTKSAHVDLNSQGKIVIEQWSDDFDQPVMIYLTLDQFEAIGNWVFKNRGEIELAWNDGVEDEPQT
jgi:hypothetical protein